MVIDLSVREDLRSLRRAETPLGAALATSTQGRHVPLRRAWCTGSQTPHIRPDIVRAANDGSGYELSPRLDPNNDRKTSTAVVGEGSQRSTIGTKQTIETACGSSAHWGEADADAYAVVGPAVEGFPPTRQFPELTEAQTLLAALSP